jgi:hypothetical protein
MSDESDGLPGLLRDLADEARQWQGPSSHPSLENLTACHAGELTPAAEEEIQEHLATCRHCTGLLLDLPAFLDAPAGALDSGDAEPDASWQEIREHLLGPPRLPEDAERPRESPPANQPARPSSQPNPRRRWLLRLAAAALVVLAVTPLSIVAWRLASPSLPPAILDLSPIEAQRGTTEPPPPPPANVHAEAASTILILRLARQQPDLRFTLELRGAGAGQSGTREVLPVTRVIDPQTLLLVLERHRLAPGQYRLRVLDADRPAAEPLGDYALDVIEP